MGVRSVHIIPISTPCKNVAYYPSESLAFGVPLLCIAFLSGKVEVACDLLELSLTNEPLSAENEQAVVWATKAAEQGHAPAQSRLGRLYLAGEGVPRDAERGLAWVRRAAEQGLPESR